MRAISLLLPVSLLLLAPSVGAQSGNYPINDDAATSRVEVTARPPAFRISDYQQDAVSGVYDLSNGWRLTVGPVGDGIRAMIDKRRPIRLIAQSPDRFVSRDGNVIMEFNRGDSGDDMMMSYVPRSNSDSRVAQMIVVTAKMAQR